MHFIEVVALAVITIAGVWMVYVIVTDTEGVEGLY